MLGAFFLIINQPNEKENRSFFSSLALVNGIWIVCTVQMRENRIQH